MMTIYRIQRDIVKEIQKVAPNVLITVTPNEITIEGKLTAAQKLEIEKLSGGTQCLTSQK